MTIQVDKDQNGNFYIKQVYFFGLISNSSGYLSVLSIKKEEPIYVWGSNNNILNYCRMETERELEEIINILKRRFQDKKNAKLKFTKVRQIKIS